MLLDEIKSINGSVIENKKFGLTVGSVFIFISAISLWRGRELYIYFLLLGSCLIISAFVYAPILKPIQRIWMTLALLMGWVMTRVILGVVFYFVMTPISLIARFTGKKFLDDQSAKNSGSYWIIRNSGRRTKEDSEKQY